MRMRYLGTAGYAALILSGLSHVGCGGEGAGELHLHTLPSQVFENSRVLRVWLPPDYRSAENAGKNFPVLFLNDGQNLFEARAPRSDRAGWKVDETAARLITAGDMESVVVVGIDDAGGQNRPREYLPYPDKFLDPPIPSPDGFLYAKFLREEVIPFVEERYRVSRERGSRTLGGSSYGALIAAYVAAVEPQLFGQLLLESPSFYVDDATILKEIERSRLGVDRVYLGVGTNEMGLPDCQPSPDNQEAVDNVVAVTEALLDGGIPGERIRVQIEKCGRHNEEVWGRRLPSALRFLFPPSESFRLSLPDSRLRADLRRGSGPALCPRP